jgi:carbon monoxide dehydrogenase subunit G
MQIEVNIEIDATADKIWFAITDIEHCSQMISSIINLQIIDKPAKGIVALKWEETRKMFGKEATETMWFTEAEENKYYCTQAQSH